MNRKKRCLDLDPKFSEVGCLAAVKAREYKLLRTSKKRYVNFSVFKPDSDKDPDSEDKDLEITPNSPTSMSKPNYPTSMSNPNSPTAMPRSPSPPMSIEMEKEQKDNIDSKDALENLITLARSAARKPSVKLNVDFSDVKGKEVSTRKTKGKPTDPMEDPTLKCDEELFDFACEASASSVFHVLADMFNKPLPLKDLLEEHADHLAKERIEYVKGIEKGRVEVENKMCVHLLDCFPCKTRANALYKKYSELTSFYKTFWCRMHKKDCKIVTEPIGLICFLHCLYSKLPDRGEEFLLEDSFEEDEAEEAEDDSKDIDFEEDMDNEKEAEDAKQLDIVAIKATIMKKAECVENASLEAWGFILPILPKFHIGGRAYVLLTDIQHVFNMREDYALSKIAKFQEEQDGWVSDDNSDEEKLESNYDAKDCQRICFNQAK